MTHARTRLGVAIGGWLLALAMGAASLATAQGDPALQGRLLLPSKGPIYLYRDGTKALVHPAPLSDAEIDAIPVAADVEVVDPTPALPASVAVALPAATTAYLVLDIMPTNCGRRPTCLESLPRVAALLEQARAAGVHVLHSGTSPTSTFLPEVEPLPEEPVVASGPDKFFNTNLDELLRARGVTTTVIVGTAANGAVLYTSFGATARGYRVVVAEDGISADTPYIERYSRFQLLNQPGSANPTNAPLAPGVTLSRTDLITFE